MEKISILIPSYKREFFLKKKLSECKLLEDNNFNFLFSFVIEENDHETKKLIINAQLKDYKIVYNNRVVDYAYKTGVENCETDYFIFMGDDDYFVLDTEQNIIDLKKIINNILKNRPEWAIAQGGYIDSNGNKIRIIMTYLKKLLLKKYSKNLISIANFIMTPSVFVKKKIVNNDESFDPRKGYACDYFTWFNLAQKYKPMIIDKEITRVTFADFTRTGSFDFVRYIKYFKYISSKSNLFGIKFFQFLFTFYIAMHNFIKKKVLAKKIKTSLNFDNDKNYKVKILHLTRYFDEKTFGGIERGIINSNTKANDLNIKNDILTTTTEQEKQINFENMKVFYAKETFEISNNVFSINFIKMFNKLKKNYDYINIHYPWPFADLVVYLFCSKKNKIILSYHADILKKKFLKKIYYLFFGLFKNKVELVNVSTEKYYNESECKKFFNENKIFVQTPGYPVPDININNVRDSIKKMLSEKNKIIFFIGRYRHYKGINKLESLIKLNGNFNFVIFNNDLEFYFKLKKYKNVNFFFKSNDDEKFYMFQNSYVHIFPSDNKAESFGLTLLEAQMFGCPSIVCDINTGVNEIIIDNFNGIVAKNEINSINSALQKIMIDENLRNQLSEKAMLIKNKYGTDNYIKYYNHLIKCHENK